MKTVWIIAQSKDRLEAVEITLDTYEVAKKYNIFREAYTDRPTCEAMIADIERYIGTLWIGLAKVVEQHKQ